MISGFSIIRNGESLGYPYLEALQSIAPLCSEIIVAHGNSDDNTGEKLKELKNKLPCKLIIVDSPWDDNNTKGGSELSKQTNIALKHCSNEICLYIQADELIPDTDHKLIKEDLEKFKGDDSVSALLFRWVHFYGNFQTIVRSKKWYRREVRAFKKSAGLQSYGDAQGFRIPTPSGGWKKPKAALSRGRVFHYGWVRPPSTMAKKSEALDRFWHGSLRDGSHNSENVYPPLIGMEKFDEAHPLVMKQRVEDLKDYNPFENMKSFGFFQKLKHCLLQNIEANTDWRPGEFKNYSLVKRY